MATLPTPPSSDPQPGPRPPPTPCSFPLPAAHLQPPVPGHRRVVDHGSRPRWWPSASPPAPSWPAQSPAPPRPRHASAPAATPRPCPPGSLPTGCGDISTNPRSTLTANAPAGPVPTNDWWSSLLFKKTDCAYSEPLHAHPVSYDTFAGGLGLLLHHHADDQRHRDRRRRVPLPATPRTSLVGVAGLNAPDVKVDGWSDWTVTPVLERRRPHDEGHHRPRPAVRYFQVTGGGNAQITTDGAADGLVQQRRHDRLHASAGTTTSRTPRPARPGRSAARRSPRPWPARATSRSPCCPPGRRQPTRPHRAGRPPTASTPTRTSPAPASPTPTTRRPAR